MKLSDFDYSLPKELVALYPLKERDNARLLVLNRKKRIIEHRIFKDITGYLHQGDTLVLNNTKVKSCYLTGFRKSGGRVKILLLSRKLGFTFNALIRPSRIKVGERLILNGNKTFLDVTDRNEVTFAEACKDISSIYRLGKMPLPPYIKREPDALDNIYYQTVYAKSDGSIAAPTAGLHFTEGLLDKIIMKQVNIAYITLHISYSTFKPVKSENILKHKMDKEYFHISEDTIKLMNETHKQNRRIFAVGTTSCRALETYASGIKAGYTDLFICPGYKFKLLDCLLTNFHLPRTTLFMLVSAFVGGKLIKQAYQEAIEKKYRFYSYGDAMLIV